MGIAANFLGLRRNYAERASVPGCGDLTAELVDECNLRPYEDLSLYKQVFSVIDTETTGLRPDAGDEVISIACVRVVGARIQNEPFYTLVDPGCEVPELATTITGIDHYGASTGATPARKGASPGAAGNGRGCGHRV